MEELLSKECTAEILKELLAVKTLFSNSSHEDKLCFLLADVSRVETLRVWLPTDGRALFAAFARFDCVFKTFSRASFKQAALMLLSSDKGIQAVSHKVAQALLKELKCVKDEAFGTGSAPIASFINSVFGDVAFLKLGLHGPRPTLQSRIPEMQVEFEKKLFKASASNTRN